MNEQDYCTIIGIKEVEIYNLSRMNTVLTKELEAVRAQLQEELARDRNGSLQ